MKKRLFVSLAVALAAGVIAGMAVSAYAMCGMCGTGSKHSHEGKAATEESATTGAINVGDNICPVTGEKITEEGKITYEYKGKAYNFCCPMCIDEFKKDPEKYIKRIEEEQGEEHGEHSHH